MDKNITHLKNLVVIAFSDGVIESKEMSILKHAAHELGIAETQLDEWVGDAENILLNIPEDDKEREKQLISMIRMATADGYFSQDEYDLCSLIADKLGYDGLNEALGKCMSRSNLKNLVALACADGVVDDNEMAVLKDAAMNSGVSDDELKEWLKKGSDFIHVIPEREEDRETQLIQMLSLAIADGEFTEDEYNLCKLVAERLGFTETELNLIIKLSFSGSRSFELST